MIDTEHIQLAHGGGGQLTAELVEQVILPALGSPQQVGQLSDAATLGTLGGPVAFTTDSYVVQPLEFPGGDIGKLAICGTVNDLAVVGARPLALSMGLVIQEGLEIALLKRVLETSGRMARQAGVAVVTGDTKVVERSAGIGLIINTSGIGVVMKCAQLGLDRLAEGDRIIVSGPLGEHGMAVMACRQGLGMTADLKTDCAPLNELTRDLIEELGDQVKFMRDPTRGGLAATLADAARGARRDIEIEQEAIPVNRSALAMAEMLGMDLLTVANEGRLIAVVSGGAAERAVAILRRHEIASRSAVIGTIGPPSESPLVEMLTPIGGRRIVQMPYGEELPRIC